MAMVVDPQNPPPRTRCQRENSERASQRRASLILSVDKKQDERLANQTWQTFTGFKLSSLSVNISNNYVFKIIIVVHFYCSIVMYFLQMSTDVYST